MKNKIILLRSYFVIILFGYTIASAQVAINTDGSNPDPNAILDIKSSDKGVLLPRLSQTEIANINNPANGLILFNTTDDKFYIFISGTNNWKEVNYGTGIISPSSSWSCGDVLSYEGQNYTTVEIGTQCWMSENLNVGTRIDGITNQTDNSTIEKYCLDNNSLKCDTFGGLYQWDEMMQYITTEGAQGVCPTGWHIPTDSEFKSLEMELGMSQSQADATGYRGTDQGSQLGGNEPLWTDEALDQSSAFGSSGYLMFPSGTRYTDGTYGGIGTYGFVWVSSQSGANSWRHYLRWDQTKVGRSTDNKSSGYSVRCLKD